MARHTDSKWGEELGNRIQAAWHAWRARHPGVKHVIYTNASEDGGMWTACVRIFRHDNEHAPCGRSNHVSGMSTDWREYRSDWAPTREDCKRRAVEDFERECAQM